MAELAPTFSYAPKSAEYYAGLLRDDMVDMNLSMQSNQQQEMETAWQNTKQHLNSIPLELRDDVTRTLAAAPGFARNQFDVPSVRNGPVYVNKPETRSLLDEWAAATIQLPPKLRTSPKAEERRLVEQGLLPTREENERPAGPSDADRRTPARMIVQAYENQWDEIKRRQTETGTWTQAPSFREAQQALTRAARPRHLPTQAKHIPIVAHSPVLAVAEWGRPIPPPGASEAP